MTRKNLIRTFLSLAFVAGLFIQSQAQKSDPSTTSDKFNTLLYYIEHMYVDSVNGEELVEHAIRKMLEELDPHSVYISKKDLQAANEPLNGSFDGIGIQFNILKDTLLVVSPITGGPSEKLGIRAGDKIVEIDGENVAGVGITNTDVMKKLKGPKGTTVNVGIHRRGAAQLLQFPIVRDKIPIFSVDASYMIDSKLGYIKVNRFAKTTMTELKNALSDLNSQGMKNLVLDLQGNGGGLLNTAIEMADEFLSEEKLIVYTEGRSFPKDETYAHRKGTFEKGKLIVLVNEGSASASEIVSGAIQDWDRGLIVGRRSFGKGLVQRPVSLPDGSAVRLTVQKYYTPSGRCIQKSYENGVEAYQMEKYDRYANGELMSEDSIQFPDSLKYYTNIKNRVVYGGGGIVPDVFVPIDTSMSSEYFSELMRNGITNSFILNYLDDNRDSYSNKFKDADDFIENFEIDQELMDKLIAYAEKEEIEFKEEDFKISEYAIKVRMKALMARNLYDYTAFFRVINVLNPAYMKAIQLFEDGTFKKMNLAHSDF